MERAGEVTSIEEFYGWRRSPAVDDSRSGYTYLNAALGERRLYLAALDAVIVGAGNGLACGVVCRGQDPPIMNVIPEGRLGRSVDVGCGKIGGRWWFVIEPGGEGVVPVDEVERAPEVLAGILAREGDR